MAEQCGLQGSPNIIPMIKSRIMKWVGHVVRMGGGDVHTGFWWETLREVGQLEDPRVDRRIILKLNYISEEGMAWVDLAQYRGRWRALVHTLMNLQAS
jgi:hypothetical protein